ncbi:MAG: hypothetical protein H0V46_05310 [Sphingomonas sp.]|nr:hypothetical protein [Sphingomonas sp.]
MPYRKAWLYVLALLALTFVAFWPGYFSKLPGKKLAHHYHAASAILWMILAIVQSWTAHHNRLALHRKTGPAIFLLFPFFLVAGMWVIHVEAATVAADFTTIEGKQLAQFGFFDPLANIAFALLFWAGLKNRYKVQLHARYLLATLLFVISPIGFRLLAMLIPFFRPDENFSYAMAGGNLIALAVTLYLFRQAPKHGQPFLIAAGFIVAQQITFETLGRIPAWAPAFASLSYVNLPFLLLLTGIASVGIAWHGWVAGARPVKPRATLAV